MKSEQNRLVQVLFVCMGNICRSPAAEGVFQHYVAQQGYTDRIRIDSAGTTAYHTGEPADERIIECASRRGYDLRSVARQVTVSDIRRFDLIIAMDHDNLAELRRIAGGSQQHIRLLGDFLERQTGSAAVAIVPDPYFGGTAGFETVLDMLESACPRIFEHCISLLDNHPA